MADSSGRPKAWVELNKPASELDYYPGEVIEGALYISSHSISAMQLRLFGASSVKVSKGDSHETWVNQKHVNIERFVKDLPTIPNPGLSSGGVHVYKIEFCLPRGIPPTFNGSHGNVKYTLSLRDGNIHLLDTPISVLPYLDLNSLPAAKEMVRREMDGVSGNCILGGHQSHNIKVVVWLQQAGCLAGEKIPLHLKIDNYSRITIKRFKVSLRCHTVYRCQNHFEKSKNKVDGFPSIKHGSVVPGTTVTLTPDDVNTTLPPTTLPSGLPGSSLIHVSYELKVTIVPQGCMQPTYLRLPLIVGAAGPAEMRHHVQNASKDKPLQADDVSFL